MCPAIRRQRIDPGNATDHSSNMKLFFAPLAKHFTDDRSAVFACAVAVAIDHGQVIDRHLETHLCEFLGHGLALLVGQIRLTPQHRPSHIGAQVFAADACQCFDAWAVFSGYPPNAIAPKQDRLRWDVDPFRQLVGIPS